MMINIIENGLKGSKRIAIYLATRRIVLDHDVNNISALDLEVSSLLCELCVTGVVSHW